MKLEISAGQVRHKKHLARLDIIAHRRKFRPNAANPDRTALKDRLKRGHAGEDTGVQMQRPKKRLAHQVHIVQQVLMRFYRAPLTRFVRIQKCGNQRSVQILAHVRTLEQRVANANLGLSVGTILQAARE